MAYEVNKNNLEEVLNKPLALIDFWAPWCMPCNRLAPVVEEISEEYKDRIFVGKANIQDNQELASRFGIMSIPNLILFKGGEQVDSIVGVVPKSEIKQLIEKYL